MSKIKTEINAGIVTFLTMSYIIFVQPAVLSAAGMDFGAVMVATCLSAAIATFIMGLIANYPIALAPGMGENFFFAYTVVIAMGFNWQTALGAVFIAGLIFLILTFLKVREALINSVPESLKIGIAAGIGLFISFIGFKNAGIIVFNQGFISLGPLTNGPVLLSLVGIVLILFFHSRKIRGGVLFSILIVAILSVLFGYSRYHGILSKPPSIAPTFLKLNIKAALRPEMLSIIFVFLFMDIFDTMGTLLGVAEYGGFMKDGKLPRANRALLADAVGTVTGALLGTSTVTSYIESVTGVEEGGKSGITAITTALLFVLALFFFPIVKTVGSGISIKDITVYPATAPVLIFVGLTMLRTLSSLRWEDTTEWAPALLIALGIPFTFSIADGMALGFIVYPMLKLACGKRKELNLVHYIIALIFILKFILLSL